MDAGGDQAGKMRDVDHDHRADFVGRLAEWAKVDLARIGAVADDDHLGPVLARELAHGVVVDALVRAAHAVGHDFEELAGKIDRAPVGEMRSEEHTSELQSPY